MVNVHAQTVINKVTVGPEPLAIAYDSGKGEMFVANQGSFSSLANGNVSVIDDATNTVVATVTVGLNPDGIAYDSGKGEIFVANHGTLGGGSVSVISDATNTVVATINVGLEPFGVAYDPNEGEVFVANANAFGPNGTISVISDTNNTVVATVTVGYQPLALAYDPATGEVFVADTGVGLVSVITDGSIAGDLANHIEVTIPVGNTPDAVAYDSATGGIYVANEISHSVSVIDGPSETVVATVPVGTQPTGLAYDSGKGEMFVVNDVPALGAGTVSVIQDSTNTVVDTAVLGANAYAIAYDSSLGELYVTNQVGGIVLVLTDVAETSTSVTCSPTSVAAGSPSTCTATVSGASPTGSVTWSSSNPTGVFSASSCTLVSSSCSVSYHDTTIGAPVITASYGGDLTNFASTGATILANFKTVVTSESSTTILYGGAAYVDQTSTTGVSTYIYGSTSPDGTSVVVESSNLGCSATPSGITLSNGQCYDVEISGVTDGTAYLCLSNQVVDAGTLMYYYSGGSWVPATGISLTLSSPITSSNGVICGNVPVSALQGTPVAMGDPQILSAPEFPAGAILATIIPLLALAMFAIYKVKTRINSVL